MVRVTTYIYPIDHHTNNLDDDATTTAALRLGLALLPPPPSFGRVPPPLEEEAVLWEPLPDLEAPPAAAMPGATDEEVVDCTEVPARFFTVINLLRVRRTTAHPVLV